jgi:hypothetical protein
MKISRILCGEGKPDGRGPDATDARNTRPAQQQTQGPILVGEQTPENTFVEVQNTQSSASIEQTPMSNIQSLWVYVLERRHKIPEILRSMAGRRPRVDDGDTNIDLPSSILTKRKDSEIPRPHSSVSQSIPLGRSSDEDHTILLAERKVADKQVHQSARSASDDTFADSSDTVSHTQTESDPSSQRGNIMNSAIISSAQPPPGNGQSIGPARCQEVSWIGAAQIKTPTGESTARNMLYDGGSTDNMITKALANACGLELRPILPQDLKVYEGANHTFIPRYYVELELRDEGHGIKEYTSALFNVAESLGGYQLLAGREFMRQHRLGLASFAGAPHLFVLTAKAATKGTYNSFANSSDS